MIPLIRPATESDLPEIQRFAKAVGVGFTSLPLDPGLIKEKVDSSIAAFTTSDHKPEHENYLFVLEDKGQTVGVSGIVSRIGMNEPFYAYHQLPQTLKSESAHIEKTIDVLHFIKARKKPTEIGTLYLEPQFRKRNFGRLLSFARFLFIANERERFASTVIAELRGYCDPKGQSPFWNAVGRSFFNLNFGDANHLRSAHPECIEELFPQHPIYPLLLPQAAQDVIGKTHPDTVPAQKLLFDLGFKQADYVDIFDAGPHLYSPTDEISIVRESFLTTLRSIQPTPLTETLSLVTNTRLDFRAVIAPVAIDEKLHATIDPTAAKALNVDIGERLRILTPIRKSS